ncbi:MAG: putative glycoside hydrolase [Actinomycetota bacterium]|nr:putative glycoside hydrolase [Actinomycetota bacterium]
MRRKHTFVDKNKKGLLRQRRAVSLAELETPVELKETFFERLSKFLPRSFVKRLEALSPLQYILIFLCVACLCFLIWFFCFEFPSPIGNLHPSPGNHLKEPTVAIRASFDRKFKPKDLNLQIDGKKVEPQTSKGNKLETSVQLGDGKHEAMVTVNQGGLMGKRSSRWNFFVDTKPPSLEISSIKSSRSAGGSKKISLSGKTDNDASIKIEGKTCKVEKDGRFKTSIHVPTWQSLKVISTDLAGNSTSEYIVTQDRTLAKGIHVTMYKASSDSDLDKLIGLVERTELNAMEIDLKDESGEICFDLANPTATEIKSSRKYLDIDKCADKLRFKNIYAICRIVTFKDPTLARAKPGLAVRDPAGGLWSKGEWVDPYSKEVWDYNLDVAAAAARAGFNEIQFDYVRFPSDGDVTECRYPSQDKRTPKEVIEGFLKEARRRLSPYNVFISADLFGLTASKQGEMGIGQDVRMIARCVDYISPMVYPSHYNPGEYKIKNPEASPASIVSRSLQDFKEQTKGTSCSLRPWLQDFTLRVRYTPEMVRSQIEAAAGESVNEWLLWNPNCNYTEAALKPAGATKEKHQQESPPPSPQKK